MTDLTDLTVFLARLSHERAVLVQVVRVQGSGPREPGAWVAVFGDGQGGTIGGGHLEPELARATCKYCGHPAQVIQRYPL